MNQPASNPARVSHPSQADLHAFGLGQCDEDRAQQIEQHVLDCDDCCRTLESLPNDSLLQQLARRPAGTETNIQWNLRDTHPATQPLPPQPSNEQFVELLRDHPKYEIVRQLGAGGMGVVYQAFHRVMHRMVALKVISPRLLQDADVKTRFRREVQIAARLNHPNVVAAFDADEIEDNLFLVSEYIEGESLDQRIATGQLDVKLASQIARQAARGLAHAHENGLIHRDVKPQNILVMEDGEAKVVDFGLASYAEIQQAEHQGLTSAGVIVGTPDYISPEQVREGAVDHRADIYSLGCTLYHALAGRPPFYGGSRVEKLAQHLQQSPKRLTALREDVPSQLDACVFRMMAKDPDQRFQTAQEVVAALEPFCSAESLGVMQIPQIATLPRRAAAIPSRPRSATRRNLLLAGGGLALLSLGGLGLSQFWEPSETGIPLDRTYRLLAIAPDSPLMRDVHLLYGALDGMGLDFELTTASNVDQIEHFSGLVPISQVDPNRYDALIVFGPRSSAESSLTSDPTSRRELSRIVSSMSAENKPVSALGAGLWTLSYLGAIRGKQVADCIHSSDSFKRDSGADWLDGESVVVDGNLVTGSETLDATPFVKQVLQMIADR